MIVKEASGKGLGLFATEPIKQGTIIIDWTNAKRYTLDQLPVPYIKDEYLQIAKGLYIGPDNERNDTVDFANHSCDPNCKLAIDLPTVLLITIKDISPGEEITYDYSQTLINDPWEMKCNCGTSRCRGIIKEIV